MGLLILSNMSVLLTKGDKLDVTNNNISTF